jgi:hypothetical protein
MLSYPVIDRDRERLAADLGYVRQAEATSSVTQPTRRARWKLLAVPTPRHSHAHTGPLGVH